MSNLNVSLLELEAVTDATMQITNMANALYSAMFEGHNSSENYGEAMHMLTTLMHKHAQDAQALFDKAIAARSASPIKEVAA